MARAAPCLALALVAYPLPTPAAEPPAFEPPPVEAVEPQPSIWVDYAGSLVAAVGLPIIGLYGGDAITPGLGLFTGGAGLALAPAVPEVYGYATGWDGSGLLAYGAFLVSFAAFGLVVDRIGASDGLPWILALAPVGVAHGTWWLTAEATPERPTGRDDAGSPAPSPPEAPNEPWAPPTLSVSPWAAVAPHEGGRRGLTLGLRGRF